MKKISKSIGLILMVILLTGASNNKVKRVHPAKVFQKKVGKIMSVHNVSIVSEAEINRKPISPRKTLNTLAGIILGVLLGIAVAFIRELTDRTVTTESFLTDNLGLTSLGIVSEIDQKDIEKTVEHKKLQAKVDTDSLGSTNHKRV